MPKQDIAQTLFAKLVKKEQELAKRCIKETVNAEDIDKAVTEFMKSTSAKKILSKDKKR